MPQRQGPTSPQLLPLHLDNVSLVREDSLLQKDPLTSNALIRHNAGDYNHWGIWDILRRMSSWYLHHLSCYRASKLHIWFRMSIPWPFGWSQLWQKCLGLLRVLSLWRAMKMQCEPLCNVIVWKYSHEFVELVERMDVLIDSLWVLMNSPPLILYQVHWRRTLYSA